MIQVSNNAINRAYAEEALRPQNVARANSSSSNSKETASNKSDRVSLSASGQAAAAIDSGQIASIGGLSPLITNYDTFVSMAENGLKDVMARLGMDAGTHVTVKVNNDGSITVASNSARNAQLQAAVNSNPELRNGFVGADNMAHLNRAVQAATAAQNATEANPARAEEFNIWAINTIQHIMATPVEFDLNLESSSGKLSGAFVANGEKLGLNERLETPQA